MSSLVFPVTDAQSPSLTLILKNFQWKELLASSGMLRTTNSASKLWICISQIQLEGYYLRSVRCLTLRGWWSPVMLNAKQIMKELWRRKMQWDEPLRGPILQRWHSWKSNLQLLTSIAVPRCYFSTPRCGGCTLELHHFCDASEVGYGAVSYLRVVYLDGLHWGSLEIHRLKQ